MILPALILSSVLSVGDGFAFARVEDALAIARPGDRIEVHANSAGYPKTAAIITVNGVTVKAIGKVTLTGGDFEYSGVGKVPRAIFQIEADDVTVEGFELTGAHNKSFNGAAIRINGGNHVTIRNCDIHGNDMGIMSNGRQGDPHAGENQFIELCRIHENGNAKDPGYNHNLYLGGTSVTVRFCDIYRSLTGHNLKSRAHYTQVEYCRIHDSANREFDFVEAWDTDRENSNAVLIGNVITKDPKCSGNREVIHFGREKGTRNGHLYLINNTIVTAFQSPVAALTQPKARAVLFNNVVVNTEEAHPRLIQPPDAAVGRNNWLSHGYQPAAGLDDTVYGDKKSMNPLTAEFGVNVPLIPVRGIFVDGEGREHGATPTYRYNGKSWQLSKSRFIGAG